MHTGRQKNDLGLSDGILASKLYWNRVISFTYTMIAVFAFVFLFHKTTFSPPLNRNASDIAQIARNITDGKGYTTRFIRPFNTQFISAEDMAWPELDHPPLYPYAMSLIFKLKGNTDQCAAWASIAFLLLSILAAYLLGTILFNHKTGLLASIVMGTSITILHYGTAGEEWAAAALWFTAVLISIAMHHNSALRNNIRHCYIWCIAAAVSAALLYLTHQIMAFALISITIYFAVTGKRRVHMAILFTSTAILIISPWMYRNHFYTNSPFLGVHTWHIMANTTIFPGDTLFRTAGTDIHSISTAILFPVTQFSAFISKLIQGCIELCTNLPGILGVLTVPFALVSILYRFKNPTANAIRGLVYLMLPVLVACFALYNIDQAALIVFTPLIAVFGSGYFMLLLETKPLHPIYRKALTGVFIIITALPAVAFILWEPQNFITNNARIADGLFGTAGINGAKGVIYTDAPWIAAWRTDCTAVWLPRSDDDVINLDLKGLPLNAVILTPESDNLPANEIWYSLYRVRLWREYLTAPKDQFTRFMLAEGFEKSRLATIETDLRRIKSNFALSDSLNGLLVQKKDPLIPEYVQIFTRPNK